MTDLYTADKGLVTLGPELLHVMGLLEARFTAWAGDVDAIAMSFPQLIGLADLATIDYLDNFPHLATLTAQLELGEKGADLPAAGAPVPADRLRDSEYALTSAACYSVYLHHRTTRLSAPRRVTTVARCFRNEDVFDGLRRLRGFTMREIVCMGDKDAVLDHLATFKPRILDYARALGLALDVQAAADPFFEQGGGRALLAQLFPVKEEFVHGGSLAIGSLNFHRNFFGERCEISLPDGTPAFTGCVAFGLERWLAALLETHSDIDVIIDRVTAAGP